MQFLTSDDYSSHLVRAYRVTGITRGALHSLCYWICHVQNYQPCTTIIIPKTRTRGIWKVPLPKLPQRGSGIGRIRFQECLTSKLALCLLGLLPICDYHTDRIFQENALYVLLLVYFYWQKEKKCSSIYHKIPGWLLFHSFKT